jgi:hypothetical protein
MNKSDDIGVIQMTNKKFREQVKIETFDELFQISKIDFTNVIIGYHDNISLGYTSPISPDLYLKYAKLDLREGGDKGLINALSNAKRSIDCLVEAVLNSLNINPDSITDSAIKFCDEVLEGQQKNISPKSLKLFCALGFAPSILISEVRTLRNKVEHDYSIPDLLDVNKAIEVADLLLNNVRAKEAFSSCIEITDEKSRFKVNGFEFIPITGLYFCDRYPEDNDQGVNKFDLEFLTDTYWYKYQFIGNELIFFFLLRAMFTAAHDEDVLIDTIKMMLNYVKIKTPLEFVKISKVHQ